MLPPNNSQHLHAVAACLQLPVTAACWSYLLQLRTTAVGCSARYSCHTTAVTLQLSFYSCHVAVLQTGLVAAALSNSLQLLARPPAESCLDQVHCPVQVETRQAQLEDGRQQNGVPGRAECDTGKLPLDEKGIDEVRIKDVAKEHPCEQKRILQCWGQGGVEGSLGDEQPSATASRGTRVTE